MSDHERYAKQLPCLDEKPDVSREPLPDDLHGAVLEFLRRLNHVRGKYGRQQLLHVELVGWERFGGDLDHLDGLAASGELPPMTVAEKLRQRATLVEAQHEAGFRDPYRNIPRELRRMANELSGPKALKGE